ncbi:hypothetical protein D3C86_1849530 [compost metagenome]
MSDVVALELEPCRVLAARPQDVFDVGERVLENAVPGAFEVRAFPFVVERLESGQHRKEPEIDRPHVQRHHFRAEPDCGAQALFEAHGRRAAGGQIHDTVGVRPNRCEDRLETLGTLVWLSGFRVARMQVQDRGTGLSCFNG